MPAHTCYKSELFGFGIRPERFVPEESQPQDDRDNRTVDDTGTRRQPSSSDFHRRAATRAIVGFESGVLRARDRGVGIVLAPLALLEVDAETAGDVAPEPTSGPHFMLSGLVAAHTTLSHVFPLSCHKHSVSYANAYCQPEFRAADLRLREAQMNRLTNQPTELIKHIKRQGIEPSDRHPALGLLYDIRRSGAHGLKSPALIQRLGEVELGLATR
jgi:hypothetical protein